MTTKDRSRIKGPTFDERIVRLESVYWTQAAISEVLGNIDHDGLGLHVAAPDSRLELHLPPSEWSPLMEGEITLIKQPPKRGSTKNLYCRVILMDHTCYFASSQPQRWWLVDQLITGQYPKYPLRVILLKEDGS